MVVEQGIQMAPQAPEPEPAQATQNGPAQHRCRPSVDKTETTVFEPYGIDSVFQQELTRGLVLGEDDDIVCRCAWASQCHDRGKRLLKATAANIGQALQKDGDAHLRFRVAHAIHSFVELRERCSSRYIRISYTATHG